jgi:tetratricopeptide (TPR) repeat protein
MNIRETLKNSNALILNHQFDEAHSLISSLSPESPSDKRMVAHYQAIMDMERGQFAMAKTKMQSALDTYGENVNLLRDLIVCQYHLQDMLGFRANLSRIEEILDQKQNDLEHESLMSCELMIGKLLEEDARLAPALKFYDRAIARANKTPHRLRALIQKARWLALYEPTQDLSLYYRELISVPQDSTTADLRIELEHSLMLIELRLIGSDHAWQRIERLSGKIPAIDQRLLIFDFIEGVFSQDGELSSSVTRKVSEFDDLDPYEEFLKKMVKGSLEPASLIHDLTLLASQLPWSSYLRLICLAANRDPSMAVRQELHRKIQLIVFALDPVSQQLWSRRLKQAMSSPEVKIEYSGRMRSISVHGKTVDLSKKKIGLQLLEGLLTKSTMTVDEAIHLLWQCPFSPEHYHRLRMSVHRLNTLVHESAGIGKIVEVDSQNVRLRPEVRLRQADEVFDIGLIGL